MHLLAMPNMHPAADPNPIHSLQSQQAKDRKSDWTRSSDEHARTDEWKTEGRTAPGSAQYRDKTGPDLLMICLDDTEPDGTITHMQSDDRNTWNRGDGWKIHPYISYRTSGRGS